MAILLHILGYTYTDNTDNYSMIIWHNATWQDVWYYRKKGRYA